MTRKLLWLALCTALLAFVGCQKPPQLTITSPPTVDLSVDGSSGTITFTANRDWTISTSKTWVTVSPSSGAASDKPISVSVQCGANTTYDDRTATVTIMMKELTQTVTIKQPANLGIVLPTKVYNLDSGAKNIEVEVQANIQYTVSVSTDWIKQTGTKGLTSTTYIFSVEENPTYDDREGAITIKSQNSNIPDQVISVKQAQKDALIVKDKSFDMPDSGGEIEFKVEANVDFEVNPSVEWIHYVETKALSNSNVLLTVDKNPIYEMREGTIEVIQKNGTLKLIQKITVKQSGRDVPAIDLGLSVKWATINIGASNPEERGNRYAWGETTTKETYNFGTYKWNNGGLLNYHMLTKYCPANKTRYWDGTGSPDEKIVLEPEDDVAHVLYGGKWRMPTHAEWTELRTKCTWTWTTQNGVKGRLVTNITNGNSIFLPATNDGGGGCYWSSSLYIDTPHMAYNIIFDADEVRWYWNFRGDGYHIRAVLE